MYNIIDMSDDQIDCYVTGGKITASVLQSVIKNGYSKDPKNTNHDIDGYVIDKALSGQRVQVYHNPTKNHTIINHRGTKGIEDLITDMKLMLNNKNNNRLRYGKNITDQAIQKYADSDITLTGHSLGSQIAKEANGKHDKELIQLNPAITPHDLLDKQKNNETIIRSSLDPISMLHTIQPFQNKHKTITIGAKTLNPLTEHSSKILDRLDGDTEIGEL